MKRKIGVWAATAIVAMSSLGLAGCNRTLSRTEETKVRSDGSMKTKETTVKENADGTVTKTEETKKTSPNP